MKKSKYLLAITLIITLFSFAVACSNKSSDTTEPTAPTVESKLDGYELADFDKFNSPAKENGLGGTLVYMDGKIKNTDTFSFISFAEFVDNDGNSWLITLGLEDGVDVAKEFIGKDVRIFCTYQGYSEKKQMPALAFENKSDRIVCSDESNFAGYFDFYASAARESYDTTASTETFSAHLGNISYNIPSNWTLESDNENMVRYRVNDMEFIFVTKEKCHDEHIQWDDFFETATQGKYKTKLNRDTYTNAESIKFQTAEFDIYIDSSTAKSHCIIAAIQYENNIYAFDMVSTPSLGSDYTDAFHSILESVTFTQPQDEKKVTTIDAGMYKVGVDISEGEYLISPTKDSGYYEITSDSTGSTESRIDNDNFSGTRYVTLKDGEYITLKRCQMTSVENIQPQKPQNGMLSNGMYKVGFDIEAGEYKLRTESSGYFEIRSNSRGGSQGRVTNDNFEGERYITVSDGQYLQLSRCSLIVNK